MAACKLHLFSVPRRSAGARSVSLMIEKSILALKQDKIGTGAQIEC
jgi:hypothetical protein